MVLLVLLFAGCSLPPSDLVVPATPAAAQETLPIHTPAAGDENLLLVELDIVLDPAIAQSVQAQSSKEADNEMWRDWAPGFSVYTLNGYQLASREGQARLFVYRVKDIEAESEHSANNIANLRQLLGEKPAMQPYPIVGVDEPTYRVPWLRAINATPMMHAAVDYLDLQDSTGMRYLTQYAQALSVVNNEELYYTFQGLTQDGGYYIAAVLPVQHPDLLTGANDAPDGDSIVWSDQAKNTQYMQKMVQILNEADPSSFTPDLTSLDTMTRSIRSR